MQDALRQPPLLLSRCHAGDVPVINHETPGTMLLSKHSHGQLFFIPP